MFLLNLQVEFELILDFIDMFYSGNNYTIINGLQLDMAPAIGSLGVKTILIQKNDNAEGTVEFGAAQFTGRLSNN